MIMPEQGSESLAIVWASFVKDTQCWMFVKEFAQRLAQLRAAGKVLQ